MSLEQDIRRDIEYRCERGFFERAHKERIIAVIQHWVGVENRRCAEIARKHQRECSCTMDASPYSMVSPMCDCDIGEEIATAIEKGENV